jgi:hypothetical protein
MGLFSNLPFLKRNAPEPTPDPVVEEPTAELAAEPAAEPEKAPEAAVEPAPAVVPASPPATPEVSAQTRAQAEELVRSVVAELPNFITVAVVSSASGQILAGQWAGHSGGAVEVAAANAEIVRQTRQALDALQLAPTEQLEDILITLRRQLHVLQVLPQQDWLLYLAIRTQDTNLALARAVLRQHAA